MKTKGGSATAEVRAGLQILEFADQTAFEDWLAAQATDALGAWLKLAKKGAEATTLTRAKAIDAALCHGWIDGQLDKYDDVHWLVRFTPRKPRSKWSEVNRTRATELTKANRMRPAGLAQINAARADGRWKSAYAPASTAEVPSDLQLALDRNPKAATFFATLKGWRLIWRNPVNARDALYIASHAGAIEGMDDARSRALLARLIDEATQSAHVYSHQWRTGDVILWDNRATMHRGRPWPGTQARLMVRTTISARNIDGLDQVRPN
jgi:uncharacterized protein YdeI (YjbR/CyaY-like superfamily)